MRREGEGWGSYLFFLQNKLNKKNYITIMASYNFDDLEHNLSPKAVTISIGIFFGIVLIYSLWL